MHIAENYTGRSFSKDYAKEYQHARNNNYVDELKAVLRDNKPKPSKEKTLEIARNYKGKNFKKDYYTEYKHAIFNNYMNELRMLLIS